MCSSLVHGLLCHCGFSWKGGPLPRFAFLTNLDSTNLWLLRLPPALFLINWNSIFLKLKVKKFDHSAMQFSLNVFQWNIQWELLRVPSQKNQQHDAFLNSINAYFWATWSACLNCFSDFASLLSKNGFQSKTGSSSLFMIVKMYSLGQTLLNVIPLSNVRLCHKRTLHHLLFEQLKISLGK